MELVVERTIRGSVLPRFTIPNSAVPRNLRKLSYNYMEMLMANSKVTAEE